MEKTLRDVISENQVYLGVQLSDVQLFDKYSAPDAQPCPGFYTDFSGVKTRLSYFGIDSHPAEQQIGAVPFPDDALHAEAIEYLAAIIALEQAQDSFTVVELGAGYGPWLVFGAKAALRRGISNINLIAVEADLQRHQLLFTNLADDCLFRKTPCNPIPTRPAAEFRCAASTALFRTTLARSHSARKVCWIGAHRLSRGAAARIIAALQLRPRRLTLTRSKPCWQMCLPWTSCTWTSRVSS